MVQHNFGYKEGSVLSILGIPTSSATEEIPKQIEKGKKLQDQPREKEQRRKMIMDLEVF